MVQVKATSREWVFPKKSGKRSGKEYFARRIPLRNEGVSHHRTDVQMELKKLDKAIAIIQSEEQSYLRNTIRKNIEDKEDE